MKLSRHFVGKGSVALLILITVAGCTSSDVIHDEPTFPSSGYMSNFLTGESVSNRFEWNADSRFLCLNIPAPGEYLLQYIVLRGELDENAEEFAIVFRADAPARISITLPDGNRVTTLRLHSGTVKPEAVGLYDDGPIIRYATPSIPTIFWRDVFVLELASPPLLLDRSDLACSSPDHSTTPLPTLGLPSY